MKCTDCPYYWKNEEDAFPCCHFEETWEAPCETEDYYEEEYYEEEYYEEDY